MLNYFFKRNFKFISLLMSVGFITGIFYSFIIFQPVYKSDTKMLIDEKSVSTQLYVLKSGEFAHRVREKILEKYKLAADSELDAEKIKKAVNIKNPLNTNIINVTAAWADPVIAKDIAAFFVNEYKNINPDAVILETPQLPFYNSFPGRIELITLFTVMFGLIASIAIIIGEVLKNSYHGPEEIEQELNLPVIGTIPWLKKETFDEPDIMFALDEVSSIYSLAFQRAVSFLKLRGYSSDKKAFVFTSSEFSKSRSTIIMNMAYGLSRTGESVVVVDADFRTPSIGRNLGLKMETKGDLTELLSCTSPEIKSFMYTIPGIDNFFIIPNRGSPSDPSLYLHSKKFKRLVDELRKSYDWVFIDVPPVLAVPDTFMVGPSIDGVILVTGLEPGKAVLRKIHRQLKTYNIEVFGIITRELLSQSSNSASLYVKQMISRVLSKNQELIPE